jgi:ubiquinone/menaquinone biosynthesis C-methylase UbiE
MTNDPHTQEAPNHHAHHAGFAGISGLVAAASMTIGREADAALAIDLARLDPTDRVVDIGCGPGAAVRRAARAGARATGIDPAAVMLRVARLLPGRGQISYLEGRAEAAPLPDASATVVWSIASVHHWGALEAAIAEVWRILASPGRFVAIERRARPGATGHASHGWTDDQAEAFASRCRAAGYGDVRIVRRDSRRRALIAVVAGKP